MKKKKELKSTDNSTVYRHTLRNYLYNYGTCDRCKPHRGCNRRKHYGGFTHKTISYPSWKIISKNPKQWMDKPIKKIEENLYWKRRYVSTVRKDEIYVTFKW